MMSRGIHRLAEGGHTFPPSAISFRTLCLPTSEDLIAVDGDTAFSMAVGLIKPKAPEVVYTLRQMGANEVYALLHEKEDRSRRRWDKWYAKTLTDIANGVEMPVEKAIEEKEPEPCPPEVARSNLDAMKNLFDDKGE